MNGREKRLRRARRVRSVMSRELVALKNNELNLRDVLESPESFDGLSRCKVYDVLRRAPHLGNTGAKKILLTSRVWPLDRLGEISTYDRHQILKCLPPRARGT